MLDLTPKLPDDTLITDVNLPTQIRNALAAVGEAREASNAALLSFQDFGKASVARLRESLDLPSCGGVTPLGEEPACNIAKPSRVGRKSHSVIKHSLTRMPWDPGQDCNAIRQEDSAMSVVLNTTRWVFALLTNQSVFILRGASVRPHASLPNIPHSPRRRDWHADGSVKIMDRIVAAFVFVMMWVLLTLVFILIAIAFYTFGQLLSYRTRPIASFVAVATFSVILLLASEAVG
jgi:hypothetical protein